MKTKFLFWRRTIGDLVVDNFSEKPEYLAFFAKCNEAFDFRIANNPESYLGKGIFKSVYKYEDWKIVPAEETWTADVVYQRQKQATETWDYVVPIVNTPEWQKWGVDKWNQYELLRQFMPKTLIVKSDEDLLVQLQHIATGKAVAKPKRGQKGEHVVVFGKSNPPKLNQEILEKKGYILQEYVDTNIDVPGIVRGTIHDVKLITIGDHVFANLRTPEPGKDSCTFDSPYSEISLHLLPASVLELHQKVRRIIEEKFPKSLYTVDVGMTKDGPVVFELNGHTAFPYLHFAYTNDFFDAFIEFLRSLR